MRTTILVLAGLVLAGCAGGTQTGAPQAATTTSVTLEKGADSGQVDRVGSADGALTPDGVKDLSFTSQIDGPIVAVFLATVDEKDSPNGAFQADTLVGSAESRKELGTKPGKGTSGLGVVEGDKLVNAPDGSLPQLGPGPHRLVLYVAPSPTLSSGARVRVYAQRPDKSVVAGPTVTN